MFRSKRCLFSVCAILVLVQGVLATGVLDEGALYLSDSASYQKVLTSDAGEETSTTIMSLGGLISAKPKHSTEWGAGKQAGYAICQFEMLASYGPTFYVIVFDPNKPRGRYHVAFDVVDLKHYPEERLRVDPLDIAYCRVRDEPSAPPVLFSGALSDDGRFSLIISSEGVLSLWAMPIQLQNGLPGAGVGGRPLDQYRPWRRIGSVRLSKAPEAIKCFYLGERLLVIRDAEVWEVEGASDSSTAEPLVVLSSKLASPVQRGREMSSEEFYGPDSLRLEPVGTLEAHPREVLVDHNQNMIFFEAPDGEWEHIRLVNGKPTVGKPEPHTLPTRAIAILKEGRVRQ